MTIAKRMPKAGPTTFITPGPRHLELLDPSPRQIVPRHIATALAHAPSVPTGRQGYASQAQHALTALHASPRNLALHILLAAAPEAYLGRIPEPFHHAIARDLPDYPAALAELRNRLAAAILARFHAPTATHQDIRNATSALSRAKTRLKQNTALSPPDAVEHWLQALPTGLPPPPATAQPAILPRAPTSDWPWPGPPEATPNRRSLIRRLALALALTPRYHGLYGPYSVAQHSMLAARLTSPPKRLHVLLHDAHEAWSGDLATPSQKAIDAMVPGFRDTFTIARSAIDARLARALRSPLPDKPTRYAIHRADRAALQIELDVLSNPDSRPVIRLPGAPLPGIPDADLIAAIQSGDPAPTYRAASDFETLLNQALRR